MPRRAGDPLSLERAHDVLADERSVEAARRASAELCAGKAAGGRPECSGGFQFDPAAGDQRDPDERPLDGEAERGAARQVG